MSISPLGLIAHAQWGSVTVSATWALLFWLRDRRYDATAVQDLFISSCLQIWASTGSRNLAVRGQQNSIFQYHLLLSLATWLSIRISRRIRHGSAQVHPASDAEKSQEPWAKPLIFPCRTTHTRLFPKKHSFSYSYLFVGIPVGWHGRVGSMLSADTSTSRAWFHVDPEDYLERDLDDLDLRAKLDHYLISQGVSPEDNPCAYLATAPRFLGYSFNPVSFWYLYSAQHELRAMILEVNNTFDERRIYYLPAEPAKGTSDNSAPPNSVTFSNKWKKDFHVSPFNSREGSYTLLAHNLSPSVSNQAPSVNNTITLLSSDGRPKLVACVYSTSPSLDPNILSLPGSLRLLLSWGWVGFVTFPRIVREAGKLFFGKKLSVWFRPEVADGSIPRRPTSTERTLESFFAAHLSHLVANASVPTRLTYHSAPGTSTSRTTTFVSTPLPSQPTSSMAAAPTTHTLSVTSPAFYSRLPYYPSTASLLTSESILSSSPNSKTLSISPNLLTTLLPSTSTSYTDLDTQTPPPPRHQHTLTTFHWNLLRHLRCPPSTQSYPPKPDSTSQAPYPSPKHLPRRSQAAPFSDLDLFVLRTSTSADATTYRRLVTRLFLAQRFTFGFEGGIVALDLVVRVLLAWVGGCAVAWVASGDAGWGRVAGAVVVGNAVHIWAFGKGD